MPSIVSPNTNATVYGITERAAAPISQRLDPHCVDSAVRTSMSDTTAASMGAYGAQSVAVGWSSAVEAMLATEAAPG